MLTCGGISLLDEIQDNTTFSFVSSFEADMISVLRIMQILFHFIIRRQQDIFHLDEKPIFTGCAPQVFKSFHTACGAAWLAHKLAVMIQNRLVCLKTEIKGEREKLSSLHRT